MQTPVLENQIVKLIPLTIDNYTHLNEIAAEDKLIQYSPSDISTPEKFLAYVAEALKGEKAGKTMPFIIYDKRSESYAGCTRFGLIDPVNKVLHIGWTWIGKKFQGTGLNKEVKYLMLKYAFEVLEFHKIEFRVDERNLRSRKAVEKIGGKLEGILRENVIMTDGFRRNTCCFGILKSEWPIIKNSVFGQKGS
ncbi:GNAT family N-acetyltransferase [Leptobacterium flavescens]|uniref:GNAT family N-acetyltransferase n=1 Tax=Leptobacterium flavescens TaxID=472055 RepID=A0A6P0UN06_9FLAO|nr:GNAT family protein [Leptobacterium flavescens]NER13892.1 GNAT family N-acetyltransferase [Leptobacterium flavescens]